MLSSNAVEIIKKLYCLPDECIDDTFRRTAKEFSNNNEEYEETAFKLQKENIWRPNSPVFFNAGGSDGNRFFSACWVADLEDSMDGIYNVVDSARKIFQFGAGIGIPIGNLREKDAFIYGGDQDKTPIGTTSGPISFMKLYDTVGDTTKSGGRSRRAAIMCVMPISHPDIMEFIACKEKDGTLKNMNISVVVNNDFMTALDDDVTYPLVSPNKNKHISDIKARKVWDELVSMSWTTGDPGILFIDTVNDMNPLKKIKLIESSNPCVTGDTLIKTDKGDITILDIIKNGTENYKVLTYNTEIDSIEYESITFGDKTREDANIIKLCVEENGIEYCIKCTEDHKIYTRNRGYINAIYLTKDDDIIINI